MNMATQFADLDEFVAQMKAKLKAVEHKHSDSPGMESPINLQSCVQHLINEIAECFHLGPYDRGLLHSMMFGHPIKRDELVDIANMAWIVDFALRQG